MVEGVGRSHTLCPITEKALILRIDRIVGG